MPIPRRHILYDLWVADGAILEQAETWRKILTEAASTCGFTVVGKQFHQFEPVGVTGILLLSESHMSVHTWPEERLATLDLFTCGEHDMSIFVESIRAAVRPIHEEMELVKRGDRRVVFEQGEKLLQ